MELFFTGLLALWWVFPFSLCICITATTLAMEGAVMFAPAFLLLFPLISTAFPELSANEAIGVALTIGVFGFGSASIGYLRQRVVDKKIALRLLAMAIPFAIVARLVAFAVPSRLLFMVFGLVLFVLAFMVLRSVMSKRGRPAANPVGEGTKGVVEGTKLIARDG
ncbi:MAG: sulfite exporter TauE/SafE family protein, partial [Chloroflexi bacterium]|nr:sulfite exporter TauE/SafE family protein [Chloroflexota bacterium]